MKSYYSKLTTNNILILLLFSLAFLSKFFFINTRDICLDEPFTIFHAQKSFWDILKLPAQNEPNPPLFMALLHFWIKIFGISPTIVRVMPLLFNSLSVVFLYLAGKKVFNQWAGIIASGIFILSTQHFYFGLETRAYSMLSCAAIASYYYFNQLINNANKNKYLAYLLMANIFLIYSHYFGLFVVFIQFVSSLFYIKNRKVIIKLWTTIALTSISFIPMAIVFVKQFFKSSQGTWVKPPSNSDYYDQIHAFLNWISPMFILLIIIGLLLFMAIKRNIRNTFQKELLVLFIWWFVPYTIMFLVSSKIPMFINRYVLYNSIPLYLFIAALIAIYYGKFKYATPIVAAIIVVFMFVKLEINSTKFYYREVQNAVKQVKKHETDSSIILIHPPWTSLGFIYYYKPEIFSSPSQYDSLLTANNIFPVWNSTLAKDSLNTHANNKIIYYQNGSIFADKSNNIFKFLNAQYKRVDSIFYPQCFYVSVYEDK